MKIKIKHWGDSQAWGTNNLISHGWAGPRFCSSLFTGRPYKAFDFYSTMNHAGYSRRLFQK